MASYQTGWTGLVARFLQMFGCSTAAELLRDSSVGFRTARAEQAEAQVAGE